VTPDEYRDRYISLGWAVVPIDRATKTPMHRDWPARAAARSFTPADFEGRNVGVVLGSVSGGLVDVDLDSAAALALAPYFLPETLTFGRKSKPASHWLYISHGLTAQKLWFAAGDGRELVELRATNTDGQGCGHQTVFPGSVHPSGEPIDFEADRPPAEVDAGDLLWAVSRLAVAAAILNDWTPDSGRHEKSLGLAGGLLNQGWSADEVRHALHAVRECAGDTPDEHKDFGHDVETTIRAFAAGRELQGFGALVLAGTIPERLAADLEKHALSPERRAAAAAALRSGSPGRVLRAGRDAQTLAALWGERDTAGMASSSGPAPAPGAPEAEPAATAAPADPYAILGRRVDLGAEPEPMAYLFEGLPFAPGGKVNAIAGAPNAGKSPTALQLCGAHVSGKAWGPFIPLRPGWAIYLDAETGVLAHHRWRRLCRAHDADPAMPQMDFRDVDQMFSEAFCQALESYTAERGANGLIVVDTYGAMLAADIDNNSPQFAHWLRQLGKLSRARAVVIVVLIHHNKSAKGGGLEGIAGNYQGAGAMQGVITLERTGTENENPIQVICSRAPERTFSPWALRWEDTKPHSDGAKSGLRAVRADLPREDDTPARERNREDARIRIMRGILRELERTPGQTTTSLKNGVSGDDKAIRRLLLELRDAGIVLESTPVTKAGAVGFSPVRIYSAAPSSNAVLEAKLRLGLVEKA
jgi:hypothetical protein